MKNGFAIVVGKVIDISAGAFAGRDGDDVKKLEVLVKPSDEAAPIVCTAFGETATKFERDETLLDTLIIKCDVGGREWQGKNGETYRGVNITIREWEVLLSASRVRPNIEEEAKEQIDAQF